MKLWLGTLIAFLLILHDANASFAQQVTVFGAPENFECERRDHAPPINHHGYAFIVGNRNYRDGTPTVDFAHNDASAFCNFVVNGLGYPPDQVFVFFDLDRTKFEIWFQGIGSTKSRLEQLTLAVGQNLELIVYYSGHGVPLNDNAYLLPVNVPPINVGGAAISLEELISRIEAINARKSLLVLEACFSGRTGNGQALVPNTSYAVTGATIKKTPSTVAILSAAGPDQVANWDQSRKMGLYTAEFLEAARGRADHFGDRDGTVSLTEIAVDLRRNVSKRSVRLISTFGNRVQTPRSTGMLDRWTFPVIGVPRLTNQGPKRNLVLTARPSEPSEPSLKAMEAGIGLNQSKWRTIQQALDKQGFDPGPADGIPGDRTRTSIARWQETIGAKPSGYLVAAQASALIKSAPEPPRPAKPSVGLVDQDPPYEPGDRFRDCAHCPEMTVIPSGSFVMGSSEAERRWLLEQGTSHASISDEAPPHEVIIRNPLAVGRYEVTRAEFQRFVSATGRHLTPGCHAVNGTSYTLASDLTWKRPGFDQDPRHPVTCVSWEDARAYVRWLSSETGKPYRLLSEAEWEYMARANSTSMRPWGDDPTNRNLCDHANGRDVTAKRKYGSKNNAPLCNDGFVHTAPVGTFASNAFGIHDVQGNVWEWVEDGYSSTYQGWSSNDSAPRTRGLTAQRVVRGGSWLDEPHTLRSANRGKGAPDFRANDFGFRVARSL